MAELTGARRGSAVGALFVARVVYAFNWYNVGAVLPLIGIGLHAGPASLGIVLGAFLVGVAIFQVPAGLASVRFGPRPVSLAGITLLGASGLASAFAPSWPVLAILRFAAGAGAAFFFSPALGLIASYFPACEPGAGDRAVQRRVQPRRGDRALRRCARSASGKAGPRPSATVARRCSSSPASPGWWSPVRRPPRPDHVPARSGPPGRKVLRSRSIWALSLALSGFWAAVYIVAQYFVDYAQTVHPGLGDRPRRDPDRASSSCSPSRAGRSAGGSRIAGPTDGYCSRGSAAWRASSSSRSRSCRSMRCGRCSWRSASSTGCASRSSTSSPRTCRRPGIEGLALGVGVVNSIQVVVGSASAIAFGYIVEAGGFTLAWIFAGVLSLGMLPLLVLVQPNRAGPPGREGGPVAVAGGPRDRVPSGP